MNVKYEAPQVEVIEVEVEHGFAGSMGWTSDPASSDYDIM